MPTPFTHLAAAQKLISDPALPEVHRQFLRREWPAFLLGSIAPDSQHLADLRRDETHFFGYAMPIDPPVETMLNRYPALASPELKKTAHGAFVAAYVGHLKVDEIWWTTFSYPNFADQSWGLDFGFRLYVLHGILGLMDERDYNHLNHDVYLTLQRIEPQNWLSFLPDKAICGWRDMIAEQLSPEGEPMTLEILGSRVPQGINGLRELLDDPQQQQRDIWSNVSFDAWQAVEVLMYEQMRDTVISYLECL
jgi:hypothetical protein